MFLNIDNAISLHTHFGRLYFPLFFFNYSVILASYSEEWSNNCSRGLNGRPFLLRKRTFSRTFNKTWRFSNLSWTKPLWSISSTFSLVFLISYIRTDSRWHCESFCFFNLSNAFFQFEKPSVIKAFSLLEEATIFPFLFLEHKLNIRMCHFFVT